MAEAHGRSPHTMPIKAGLNSPSQPTSFKGYKCRQQGHGEAAEKSLCNKRAANLPR